MFLGFYISSWILFIYLALPYSMAMNYKAHGCIVATRIRDLNSPNLHNHLSHQYQTICILALCFELI